MMRLISVFIVFLIFVRAVSGYSFDFSLSRESIPVTQGTTESIFLLINSSKPDRFVVSLDGQQPWVSVYPTQPTVRPGVQKIVKIFFSPGYETMIGTYAMRINLLSTETHEILSKPLYVTVTKGYEKRLAIERVLLHGNLVPGGNLSVKIKVKNYYDVPISGAVVNIDILFGSNRLFNFKSSPIQLNPEEDMVISHTFYLEKSIPWGKYILVTKLIHENTIVESDTKTFSVAQLPILMNTTESSAIFLGYKTKIIYKNEGNYPSEEIEIIQKVDPGFYYGPKPTRKDGNYYVFTIPRLAPNESFVLEYEINCAPILLLPLAAIVLVYIIFFELRTVRIKKFIIQEKPIKEGEEFTIGIEIKNKSGYEIQNVVVRDFIPSVFKIKKFIGTKPTHKSTVMGTEIMWKIGSMTKDEIRVLGYKVVPVFGVTGKIKLPRSHITYNIKESRKIKISGHATLGVRY